MHNYEPRIFHETSSGLYPSMIQDEMLKRRELECVGEINSDSVYALCRQLRYLQGEDPDKEITMYINSPGGEISSGLALYDVMQGLSCPIHTICMGTAASMGALLFVAGKQRDILPHGRIMIHDPLISGNVGGNALQIQEISRSLLKIREETCGILARHTGKTLEEIYEKTAKDSWFNAEEAVRFGLADKIIYHV